MAGEQIDEHRGTAMGTRPADVVRTLPDGTALLIRPLQPDDRDELRAQYGQLSPESRRLRFVSAPDRLSDAMLDHLLDVDFEERYALVGALADVPGAPGIAIARYVRRPDDPSTAEAAITVLDEYQGRGVGTALLTELVRAARRHGIRTFVGDVMWDNREFLDGLRAVGADVTPGEPGSASVRVDLADTAAELRRSAVYQVLRTFGAR